MQGADSDSWQVTEDCVGSNLYLQGQECAKGVYLSGKEKEVVDIMMVLYDEEEIMRSYIESERHDEKIEIAKRLLRMKKLSYEEIAVASELAIDDVEKLAGLGLA